MTFVGRRQELRRLHAWLTDGRHVVVTGAFGSGRTALVRRFAMEARNALDVHFLPAGLSRRGLASALLPRLRGTQPQVAVVDDVIAMTRARATFMASLARTHGFSWVVIAERGIPRPDLLRLRTALAPAPVLRLGRLTDAMAGRLLQRLLSDRGVSWSPDDIRLTARSTHGVPLLLHHAAAAAVGERAEVR